MVSNSRHIAHINLMDGEAINPCFGYKDKVASAYSATFNKNNVNKHADRTLCWDSRLLHLKQIFVLFFSATYVL